MGSTFSSAFENIRLEYRAVRSTFSSAFKIKHTLNIELWVRHSALHSKTYILNIELWDRRSALHSKYYTLWISSYGFDFHLCIRKHTSWISSCEIDVQLCIQNNTHFEYRAMGSTFSSAFENIRLNIELWHFCVSRLYYWFQNKIKPYRFYVRTVRGLVYRTCDLVKKARFFSKQILPCKLFW